MSKQQLSQEESQALADAISKLSEEDQAQIAAAGKINDEQCEEIKKIIDERIREEMQPHLCYGMRIPSVEKRVPPMFDNLNASTMDEL